MLLVAFFLSAIMASPETESIDLVPGSPNPSPLSPTTCSPGPSPTATAPGRPKRSPVWDYFTYDSVSSLCKVDVMAGDREPDLSKKSCDHTVSGKFPTNLKNHLKKHHPTVYENVLRNEEEAKAEASTAKALGPHKQL